MSKNGEKVPLSARNFDLLLFMVENGGRILEHDELLDKVWAGTFVEQATLKKGISALRRILAEDPENEFIKTIPRRGYSFISTVHIVPEAVETFYVRETEQEIIVEEYEETDEEEEEFHQSEKIIELPAVSVTALPPSTAEKINVSRLVMIGMAGLAAVVLVFFALKPYLSKTVEPQFSVENVRVNRITNSGKTGGAIISPDGSYLLYPTMEKEGASLWLRQMTTNSVSRLTPPIGSGFWGLAFAPDNSYVYYILNNQSEPEKRGLYKVPLLGGEPRRIKENVSSIAVSPDGKRIALVRLNDKTTIFTVNTDGDEERTVTELPSGVGLLGISWTPDGTSLLCTFRKVVEHKPLFYVSEISSESGSEKVVVSPQEKNIIGAVWLPDKSAVLCSKREPNADIRQIWQFSPASQEWRRVTNDNNSYRFISLTRDGKNIVTSQESRLAAIWIANDLTIDKKTTEKSSLLSSSGSFKQITDGVNNFDRLDWAADNILFYSVTDDSKEMVFSINADGTKVRQITGGDDGVWLYPSVAGGGRSIAFISTRSGIKEVWRIDEDGKNLTKMTQTDTPVSNARILRDNSTVIYTTQKPEGTFLFKQNPDGQTTQLTEVGTGDFTVSADEKLLALEVLNKNTGKYQVEIRSMADGTTSKTFNILSRRQIRFTPDGKNLAYDASQDGISQIMIQPLDGGEPYALTDFQTDDIFSFAWSADGKRLAVIRGKQLTDAVIIKDNDRR